MRLHDYICLYASVSNMSLWNDQTCESAVVLHQYEFEIVLVVVFFLLNSKMHFLMNA